MRRRTCSCGACSKCRHREAERARYARLSLEQRRAVIARRDVAAVRRAQRQQARRRREDAEAATKQRARWIVNNAGLQRWPCELGPDGCDGPLEWHHDDYSKPLDVRSLCRRHHAIVDGRAVS